MKKVIMDMIEEYEEKGDFSGEISDEYIINAERKLGCKFPIEYRDFIKSFGSGGICGVDLLGIETSEYASVVVWTEKHRELGLSNKYLVIKNVDEFVYCLGIENNSVISWDSISKEETTHYNSFDEFLLDTFQEAIDNWD